MRMSLVSGNNWASVVTSWAKGCSPRGSSQRLDLNSLANASFNM